MRGRSPVCAAGSFRNRLHRPIPTAARRGSTSARRSHPCDTTAPWSMPNDRRSGSPTADARASYCALRRFYGPDSWFARDLIRYVRRGFVPIPGAVGSYISSVSHDDAASAVMAALTARAGALMSSMMSACAAASVSARSRRFWGLPHRDYLFGSLGEMLARSVRVSNRKLREECAWVPKYPSMREGWRAVAAAIQLPEPRG
jgi:acetyl esterase/lipase